MTLDEAFRRVIRSHLLVIAVVSVLPVLIVLGLQSRQPVEWQSTVRIQAASVLPASTTEAEALSSRVLAIASTPDLVGRALRQAGVTADPVKFATESVTAQRLGESPVVELTVSREDRTDATDVVQNLSELVVSFLNDADRERFRGAIKTLDERLDTLRQEATGLSQQLGRTPLGPARERTATELSRVDRAVAELASQRAGLMIADATRGRAVLIGNGRPTEVLAPTGLVPMAGLALVLGVCLGVVAAAAIETVRPKVPTARSLARLLDVPLIASGGLTTDQLRQTMDLVARRHGLETLVVVPADPKLRLTTTSLVRRLSRASVEEEPVLHPVPSAREKTHETTREATREGAGTSAGTSARGSARGAGRPEPIESEWTTAYAEPAEVSPQRALGAGVVVVCAGSVLHRHVDALRDLLQAARWPVVGILDVREDSAGGRDSLWTGGRTGS